MNPTHRKLNLGCGSDIRHDCVNMDMAALDGVDVVHNLQCRPYPFEDNAFDEIHAIHILEHLPDTIKTLEEWWRILMPEGRLIIRVPYWNAADYVTDPTHIKPFNEHTLDIFDPTTNMCLRRPYYTHARFRIHSVDYFVFFRRRGYVRITNRRIKKVLTLAARHLCNIIAVLEWDLRCVKTTGGCSNE